MITASTRTQRRRQEGATPSSRAAEQGPRSGRSRISWWLSRVDRSASRPWAALLVIGAAGIWIGVSVAVGFPERWEVIFQTLVAALTLVMVFVIQHTQARHQRAT